MRRRIGPGTSIFLLCLILMFLGMGKTFAQPQVLEKPLVPLEVEKYVPGEIIVKFKPGVRDEVISELNRKLGTSVLYTSPFAGFKRLKIPKGKTVEEMVNIYKRNPNVEYAEPNFIVYAFMFPNDEYYFYQWHLDNPEYGGINMEAAWDISTGSGVTVAIIDTGIAYEDHEEFVDNPGRGRDYWITYAQAPDLAGTDFVPGYDFVNDDTHPNDDEGHGTHVTGTIAQTTNNGLGVAGVAFNCSIMPVKVLDSTGSGTYTDIADGIYFAANNGARVINMSLGGTSESTTLEDALEYAYNAGVTIICAAGNSGPNGLPIYPAAYDAYCIAVGATRYDETVSYYSTTGSYVDIAAPGGDIYVDQNGDGYGDGVLQQTHDGSDYTNFGYWFYQGTSMATPHVSGVATLLIANGVATTPDEVREALQSTAEDKGPTGWDSEYGYGIVDAYAALNYTTVPNDPPWIGPLVPNIVTDEDAQTTYNLTDHENDKEDTDLGLTWSISGVNSSLFSASIDPVTDVLTITPVANANGSDVVPLTLKDSGGLSNAQDITITIKPVNDAPVADANGPYTGVVDVTVQFDGSGSYDVDGDLLAYTWDFGDDSTKGTGVSPTHTYAAAGEYRVTLVVNDGTESSTPSITKATITEEPTLVMHVASIDMSKEVRRAGPNTFITAVATVKVVDAYDNLVENAMVSGHWSGLTSDSDSGLTDAAGVIVLKSDQVKNARGTFTFTVYSVTKEGLLYNPSANVETSDSITVP